MKPVNTTFTAAPFRSQIQSVNLRGPAGRLEALLNTGRPDAPFATLVCHPHPPSGGTMHTKVVYHAMKAFNSFGLPVLRFNFRGTGLSEGSYDDGRGEKEDVRAALDWLAANFHLPILFAGFSFGSNVGMRACCGDARVQGLIALGLPIQAAGRSYRYTFLENCPGPKLFLSGDHDEFGPRGTVETVIANAPEPKQLTWIENADHFFAGVPGSPAPKLDQMQAAMRSWLATTFPQLRG
jgi:alpha/beta superfamily hydrolase